MAPSYKFQLEEDYGEDIVYSFSSPVADYSVYFDKHGYDRYIGRYPNLLNNAVGLNILGKCSDSENAPPFDSGVRRTIDGITLLVKAPELSGAFLFEALKALPDLHFSARIR